MSSTRPEPRTPADGPAGGVPDAPDTPDAVPATTVGPAEPGPARSGAAATARPAGDQVQDDAQDDVVLVDPARVRRAPRYRAFFTLGAVVGVIVGVVLGVWFTGIGTEQGSGLLKPGVYVSVVVLGSVTFFVLLAGALAVLADRRSLRRR
ncbi:hypothetical protein [Isoptericola dokdonensis]|uniref:Uncharacterized protein n=1 Tax=Isoptericola dokdonensis DS-3 TaxID=1300344 RepID=A0A161II75_9MICO|nr:hypothetical protein [Isoptericola dokdonensis]ANC31564.1 hypothetical protein I598_2021 [Isoptericola dokdonensis DS-3]